MQATAALKHDERRVEYFCSLGGVDLDAVHTLLRFAEDLRARPYLPGDPKVLPPDTAEHDLNSVAVEHKVRWPAALMY